MKAQKRYIGLLVTIIGAGLFAGHASLSRFISSHIACTSGLETNMDTEADVIVGGDTQEEDETIASDESPQLEDAQGPAKKFSNNKRVASEEKSTTASDIADLATEAFDNKIKQEAVVNLVEKGIAFLTKNSAVKAFQAFNTDKEFSVGELYIFVFDPQGVCLSHGQDHDLLWKNLYELKSIYGTPVIQQILKEGLNPVNNGWTNYEWRGASKVTYVKKVVKADKTYVIGAGYYPHSKESSVENLVKGAVELFNSIIKSNRSKEEVFSAIGYPLGRFVSGDLYLYALAFDGIHAAHGDIPGLIGTNGLNYRDANGKMVNQEIIQKLKAKGSGGVWIEYFSKNAPKKAYAERVVDEKGKEYFIACGYYPTADRRKVVELVKKGYQYMKGNGKAQATKMFSHTSDFIFGDLYLSVYDLKGVCVANGGNPDMIGTNRWDVKDETGEYYIREMIQRSANGPFWIDYKSHNSFKATYVERIALGTDEYIISCGIYPLSKFEKMYLLARSGVDYLKSNTEEQAYGAFVDSESKFVRGDLFVFAIDSSGICFSYGPDQRDLIWRNLMPLRDDTGKQFVKTIINHTTRGAGTISYTLRGMKYIVYAEPVQKNDKTVIVGSGYFL